MSHSSLAHTFPPSNTKTTGDNLNDLMINFPLKNFKKGAYIVKEGQTPKHIYYIESGKVLTLTSYPNSEKILANGLFVKGEFVNFQALTNSQPDNNSIKALSKVAVRQIPTIAFLSLMRQHQFLNQMVIHNIVRQLDQKTTHCHQTVLYNSNQRIVQFLLDYVAKAGERVGYEWVVRDFLTQAQIALLSNTGRQTVSTLLNDLRRENIIHFTRKYMVVRDLDLLKAYLLKAA